MRITPALASVAVAGALAGGGAALASAATSTTSSAQTGTAQSMMTAPAPSNHASGNAPRYPAPSGRDPGPGSPGGSHHCPNM